MSKKKNKQKKQKQNVNESNIKKSSALTDQDIESIIDKTETLIYELEKRSKKVSLYNKKSLIKSQIEDLQKLLDEKQYYLLNDKLKSFEQIEKQEQSDKEQLDNNKAKAEKSEKNKIRSFSDFVYAIKTFDNWPLYSRTKRINNNYEGKDKTQRLLAVYGIFILLFIVAIIGLLVVVRVIPYAFEGADNNRIFPLICFILPLVCMLFV